MNFRSTGSFSIFQLKFLLVVDVDCFTQLHFDQFQLGLGDNSMTAACGHGDHIASLHMLLHTIHNGLAIACNDRPDRPISSLGQLFSQINLKKRKKISPTRLSIGF